MVIDEVQRVPGLILAIKAEVDRLDQPGCFVLTGSSDFITLPRVPDSLAGRAVTIALGGLSMGEITGVREDFATRVRMGLTDELAWISPWTRADYLDAIVRGGYPELRPLDEPWRTLWADSYIDRVTSRDIHDVAERVAAPRVRAVLELVAQNQSGELVKARLAAAAGISERSVTTCLDALRAVYMVVAVPAAYFSGWVPLFRGWVGHRAGFGWAAALSLTGPLLVSGPAALWSESWCSLARGPGICLGGGRPRPPGRDLWCHE